MVYNFGHLVQVVFVVSYIFYRDDSKARKLHQKLVESEKDHIDMKLWNNPKKDEEDCVHALLGGV